MKRITVFLVFFCVFLVPFSSFGFVKILKDKDILAWKNNPKKETALLVVYINIDGGYHYLERLQLYIIGEKGKQVLVLKAKTPNVFVLEVIPGKITIEKLYGESDSAPLLKDSGMKTKENFEWMTKYLGNVNTVKGKIHYFDGLKFQKFSPNWNDQNMVIDAYSEGKNFSADFSFVPAETSLRSAISKFPTLSQFLNESHSTIDLEDTIFEESFFNKDENSSGANIVQSVLQERDIWNVGYRQFKWNMDFVAVQSFLKQNYDFALTKGENLIVAKKGPVVENFFFKDLKNGQKIFYKIEARLPKSEIPAFREFFKAYGESQKDKDKNEIWQTAASKVLLKKIDDSFYSLSFLRAIE